MKSKLDFYISFYEQLALQGFGAYVDHTKEHIAMICKEGYNFAYLTKEDTIEPNPHAEVDPAMLEQIREIAREVALSCGICTEKPYDETRHALLMDGAYTLAALDGTLLSCRQHPILGYVFTVRKQGNEPQDFYNESDAKQAFAIKSGLVDERRVLSDDEMKTVHSGLLKMRIALDRDLSSDECVATQAITSKIETVMPELGGYDVYAGLKNELSEGVEP